MLPAAGRPKGETGKMFFQGGGTVSGPARFMQLLIGPVTAPANVSKLKSFLGCTTNYCFWVGLNHMAAKMAKERT